PGPLDAQPHRARPRRGRLRPGPRRHCLGPQECGESPVRPRAAIRQESLTMDAPKNVEELCKLHQMDTKALAEKSGLDEPRVLAIVLGRWTPSPAERDRIAAA